MASDVLIFVESRLCAQDSNVELEGFTTLRNDFSTQRIPYGTVLFIKHHLRYRFQPQNENAIEMTPDNIKSDGSSYSSFLL